MLLQKKRPTKRALDGWDSAPFSGFIYTRTESCSRSFIHARPPASNASRWAPARQLRNKWRKKSNHLWRKLHEKVFILDINSFIV